MVFFSLLFNFFISFQIINIFLISSFIYYTTRVIVLVIFLIALSIRGTSIVKLSLKNISSFKIILLLTDYVNSSIHSVLCVISLKNFGSGTIKISDTTNIKIVRTIKKVRSVVATLLVKSIRLFIRYALI